MDTRMQLEALSYEIDQNKEQYMEFVQQTVDNQDMLDSLVRGATKEERHLVELELMILEQVADWEGGAPGGGGAAPGTNAGAGSHDAIV